MDLRTSLWVVPVLTARHGSLRENRTGQDMEHGTRRWRERYIPAQQFYFAAVRPTDHVDIIVHNDEPQKPAWEHRTH
ncbi:hypothetical protein [Phytohabitans houttuyneae]|nr:hypothetical protein [Phytohabitans houttuyneae]